MTANAIPLEQLDTDALEDSIYRKVSWRIVPLFICCFLFAYLDRVNISFAKLQMASDLGFSETVYGLGASLFFVGYFLFEVPSNVLLHKIGARIWIARIMVSWGIASACMMFVQTEFWFYTLRFLIGVMEAGFVPGVLYFFTQWYPSSRRARVNSYFKSSIPLCGIVGGPIAGLILGHFDGVMGLAGWRWLFLLEGIPAAVLGVVVLRYLPDTPEETHWLDKPQKDWLSRTIKAEQATTVISHKDSWHVAFRSRQVWLLSLFWLLQAFGTIGVTLFLPLIVQSVSKQGSFVVSLLSAMPFFLACVFMYLNGRHSDRTGERGLHLGGPLLLAGVLLGLAVFTGNQWLAYVMLVAAVGLNWAATPVFWATTTEYLSGPAAAVSIALINSIANIAGLGLPPVMGWIKDATQSYDYALLLVAVALLAGGVLGMYLGGGRRAATPATSQGSHP